MSLKDLSDRGKLRQHKTSKDEIGRLFEVVKRDFRDSRIENLSLDRRFSAAYNAVLQLATIILYSSGYSCRGYGHHYYTFQAVKYLLEDEFNELIDYFDDCRVKRNKTFYNQAGIASEKEVREFIEEGKKFYQITTLFLEETRPELL
ncbi:MAG: hypothetical protein R6U43_04765 [Candidatus Krumholzibacteriales bacterium]